jgi:hypothetical protein
MLTFDFMFYIFIRLFYIFKYFYLIFSGLLDKLEVAFSSYSVYTNLRNIFTTRPRYERYHIPSLDGIRSLSVMWIIYGMTYVYGIIYFECWTTGKSFSSISDTLILNRLE